MPAKDPETPSDRAATPADPAGIACWQRIDSRLTTSGAVTREDLVALAGLGVTTVINLALPGHPDMLADEDEAASALGIAYVPIPVPFATPGEDQFAAFVEAMEKAENSGAPVHVHCLLNWRVSAFVYRWHRARGMPEAEARALMRRQWEPETSDHPDAPAWVRFIAPAA